VRFASTTGLTIPTTTAAAAATVPTAEAATATVTQVPESYFTSVDNAADFTIDSLLDMPETIGFLKALGLDYGWGPTAIMEFVMEHVHVLSGTPWWASIILTALLVRAAMFRSFMAASDTSARMAVLKPMMDPLTAKMKKCSEASDTEGMLKVKAELSQINKRAGIHYWKLAAPLLQVFTGYGTWKLLRGMSDLPLPGLEHGGIFWISNLTIPDPYLIIPILTSLGMHYVIKVGGIFCLHFQRY